MIEISIDIETVPSQDPAVGAAIRADIDAECEAVQAPGNYKKPESIAAYIEEERARLVASYDERYQRAGLDAATGQICSIALAVNDRAPLVNTVSLSDLKMGGEAELLHWFGSVLMSEVKAATGREGDQGIAFEISREAVWIGFNHRGFDLPYLWKRGVILQQSQPFRIPYSTSPSDRRIFDCMLQWAGFGGRISQKRLAAILGIESKLNGLDGSKVYQAMLEGREAEIAAYNVEDVETVRTMYRRMTA